jgi:GMP synthase PP-ATPase subunit
MITREEQLMNEVDSLRNQLEKVKGHLAEAISSIINKQFEDHMEKVRKTWEQKTYFKKDKVCSVNGCNRRYSSRIALRAHMKRKHRSLEL